MADASQCDRCGGMFDRLHPLDVPMGSNVTNVCNGCLKDWEETVDV